LESIRGALSELLLEDLKESEISLLVDSLLVDILSATSNIKVNTPIYWNFGDPQILHLVGQLSNIYLILPNITDSSQFGTIFYIVISSESTVPTTITINTNSPYTWLDETNTWVSSRSYSSYSRVFAFVCFQNVSGWKLLFSHIIGK
jgi:hypothetical protein